MLTLRTSGTGLPPGPVRMTFLPSDPDEAPVEFFGTVDEVNAQCREWYWNRVFVRRVR